MAGSVLSAIAGTTTMLIAGRRAGYDHGHHSSHSTASVATDVAALIINRPVQGHSKVPAVPCGQSDSTVATDDAALSTIASQS